METWLAAALSCRCGHQGRGDALPGLDAFDRQAPLRPGSIVVHWEEGKDKPWYLVTGVEATRATIRTYKVRMWIEEMFGDMKGHDVDLEATHLRDLDRLSRFALGVCLASVWLISVGIGGWSLSLNNPSNQILDECSPCC